MQEVLQRKKLLFLSAYFKYGLITKAVNYKNLNAINGDGPVPAKRLETAAAIFDLKNSEFQVVHTRIWTSKNLTINSEI